MFSGYLGSQSCSMEPKHHFGTTLKSTTFFHLTIPRHQNTKTAAYKLSKNDWVRPFFEIFKFAREKLFVTVAFDHPVFHMKVFGDCPLSSFTFDIDLD